MSFPANRVALMGQELRAGPVAKIGSTKRIQELNGMLHSSRPNVDITRSRVYTQIYRETEGMPPMMRRYKASAAVYRALSEVVYDHEQLVGWPTKRIRGANFAIEMHAHWIAEDLPEVRSREYDPFDISDEDFEELQEDLLPYWKNKTLAVQWGYHVDAFEWSRAQFGGVSDISNYLCTNGSHFIPRWTDVIAHGFVKYYEEAKQLLVALDPNDPASIDKRIFYQGIIEVLEAIRDWGERMSAACSRKAAKETDPVRKQELEDMAAMMKRVPWGPATSFYDAMETAWAVCFFLFVEGAGPSITWGRIDQYLYPYYKADIEKGILTPESALELIEELYIRVNTNVWFQSSQMAYIFGGNYRYPHVDVGGLDENGQDAANELSYLFLRAMRYVRTTAPNISVLLHPKNPELLLREACELAAEGMGHPSFFNVETLFTMLTHRAAGPDGYSNYTRREILKYGSPLGCIEPGVEGQQYGHTDSGIINVASATTLAVTNGVMPDESDNIFSGKLITFESGAPSSLTSFEAFYEAVKAQIQYAVKECHANLIICEKLLAEQFMLPTFTILLEGALQKAVDAVAGSAKVNIGPTIQMVGFATMVDSVAAVKKVVFDDQEATLQEVCDACMNNFKGYDVLRAKLIAAPKFGNDDDYADRIAVDLWKWFADCVSSLKMYRGNYCDPAIQMVANVGYGSLTGATPNGRLAGMPLSYTRSASPMADRNGPGAAARSYRKLDYGIYSNGTMLNMWIKDSELVEG